MKFFRPKEQSQGPSSAIGIMRFNESFGGPKLRPEWVLIGCAGLILGMIALKMVFSF